MGKKVAVITGASSGIGRGIAQKLIADELQLVLNGRTCRDVFSESDDLVLVTDDLLEEKTAGLLLDRALERFGRCDYLFVNAGMLENGTIEEIDIDRVCRMARLKVESAYRIIYTFLKHFVAVGTGHVIITSSILGTKVRENSGAYAGCSFALEALAESLRMELSDTDIQISCIEPGLVETNLQRHWDIPAWEVFGIEHPLQPEDIADVVEHIITRPAHVRVPRYLIMPKGHRL